MSCGKFHKPTRQTSFAMTKGDINKGGHEHCGHSASLIILELARNFRRGHLDEFHRFQAPKT